jgi:predicted protein tyrosine phosphatase
MLIVSATDYSREFPNDGFHGEEPYTGLRLEVCGQWSASQHQPGPDEVCISISCERWGERVPRLSGMFADILRLEFNDVQVDSDGTTISPAQAEKVAKFVLKHRDKKKMLVHCFAGVNRSRSTASAIAEVLQLPYTYTAKNQSVYNAVKAALLKELEPIL